MFKISGYERIQDFQVQNLSQHTSENQDGTELWLCPLRVQFLSDDEASGVFAVGKSPSDKECSIQLTLLKKEEGYEWLNNADSTALQSALSNLADAYQNFFEGRAGYPKYKSKKDHNDSYTSKNNNNAIRLEAKRIKLPKIGWVKTKVSRPAEGRIVRATVSHVPSGKYYVSVVCEVDEMTMNLPETQAGFRTKELRAVGIDMGLTDYIVAYDGEAHSVSNPGNLDKSLDKLAHEQRVLSRKTRGSRHYSKQSVKVARIHERIHNQRMDFLDKLSTRIVMNYELICIEDLDVKGLIRQTSESKDKTNRAKSTRNRHIEDAAWGTFVSMLEYKCRWYGKTLVKVGRYYPSTQLCSCCGKKNPLVKDTSIRKWDCPVCGTHHDRDENAAKNILAEGLRIYRDALKLGYPVFGTVLKADEMTDCVKSAS